MAKFTEKQRQELLGKVNLLRKQGLTVADACKKAHVSLFNYNYWTRTRSARSMKTGAKRVLKTGTVASKSGAKAFQINLAGKGKNQPMVIAIGKPADVNSALANLAAIFGN